MQVKAIKTRIFKENEDLISFIFKHVEKIPENSILVVTSKIVALSEGRTVVVKNDKERENLIKEESTLAVAIGKKKHDWLTMKDGLIMANAGIDESNANGKLILLPKDSFNSAELVRKKLIKKWKTKNLGVLITDSRIMPGRAGVVGLAVGYAGFSGVRNYIGQKDIFSYKFKVSRTDLADSLATAAVLCMGEGKEQQPLALITEAPVVLKSRINKKELYIDPKEDIYRPFFSRIK